MGMIPKQTKTEQQISLGLINTTLKRIIGLIITAAVAAVFAKLMPKVIAICFIATAIIIYIKLTSKAPSNPTKPYWLGLCDFMLYCICPKKLYNTNSKEYILTQSEKEAKRLEKEHKKQKPKAQKGKQL